MLFPEPWEELVDIFVHLELSMLSPSGFGFVADGTFAVHTVLVHCLLVQTYFKAGLAAFAQLSSSTAPSLRAQASSSSSSGPVLL